METYEIDPVVQAVKEDLERRSELGFKKYGKTLASGGYSERQRLQDFYEELLDACNYVKALIMLKEGSIEPGERNSHDEIG